MCVCYLIFFSGKKMKPHILIFICLYIGDEPEGEQGH